MHGEFIVHENTTPLPTIHVVSDSVGLTAQALARAAAAQFGVTNPNIEVLPHVRSFEEVKQFIAEHGQLHKRLKGDENLLIFYTLVDGDLRRSLSDYCESLPNVVAVDLMTDAMNAIAKLSGQTPSKRPGGLHVADQHYFRRIEAIEFTIAHDDGRNPQEMTQADIVLLGVSRSSKTPTSIYLAQQGYKVSNIPLDKLELLANLFSVSPSVLAGWEDCPKKEIIPPDEAELLALHRQLNDEGQGRLREYADDLVSSGKYIKSNPLGLVAK